MPGYFEVPTDEGWRITLELAEGRLELADAWGMNPRGSTGISRPSLGPTATATSVSSPSTTKTSAPCATTFFVAKRAGVDLRWRRSAALRDLGDLAKRRQEACRSRIEIGSSGIICASGLSPDLQSVSLERSSHMFTSYSTGGFTHKAHRKGSISKTSKRPASGP